MRQWRICCCASVLLSLYVNLQPYDIVGDVSWPMIAHQCVAFMVNGGIFNMLKLKLNTNTYTLNLPRGWSITIIRSFAFVCARCNCLTDSPSVSLVCFCWCCFCCCCCCFFCCCGLFSSDQAFLWQYVLYLLCGCHWRLSTVPTYVRMYIIINDY